MTRDRLVLISILILALVPEFAMAQAADSLRDAVILKDRQSYIGKLIQNPQPDSVSIQLENGQVRTFHSSAVATITNESVLRDYVKPGTPAPSIILSAKAGFNLNTLYGPVVGLSAEYYVGNQFLITVSVLQHFGSSRKASPAIRYVVYPGSVQTFKTPLTETSQATVVDVSLGVQLGRGAFRVMTVIGYGVAIMRSAVFYEEVLPEGTLYERFFDDIPADGGASRMVIPVGISFVYELSEHFDIGLDLEKLFLTASRTDDPKKEFYSFIERNENTSNITFRLRLAR